MKREIEVLNFDELNVEELEQRLDMAIATGAVLDGWLCGCDTACVCNGNTCTTQCAAQCGTLCAAYCATACGADCPALCGADICGTNCVIPLGKGAVTNRPIC
jgi:hypothetical protein